VVGAGPAGLACASVAASRGHQVSLFDEAADIGGQFNMARAIPGKQEFDETLRYYRGELARHGVELKLGRRVDESDLRGFDEIVLATGVRPRTPAIEGIEHPKVLGYVDVLERGVQVGSRVAIIGAGGIGFDMVEFLSHVEGREDPAHSEEAFAREWGIDRSLEARGGVAAINPEPHLPGRDIWLLQRSEGKLGARLSKTTGWVHRLNLKRHGIQTLSGVSYQSIDDGGLHIEIDGETRVLEVDHVVICAGQVENRELAEPLERLGLETHLIGGAHIAGELDANRAIRQGCELAARL
jgi:2,4-dienoyl-CoA reductase (NADPH2)